MAHAGTTPAHPGTRTPRTPTAPSTDTADRDGRVAGGRPADSTDGRFAVTTSPFARLTATATYRLPDPDDTNHLRADGDWHDPDPGAGLALGAGNTPYDRALRRWRPGVGRDRARTKFRMTLRLLLGSYEIDVSEEALRAYPWHQLTAEDARDFHAAVTRHYNTQASRNDIVCILRALVRECYRVEVISALRRELMLEELFTLAPGRSTRRHRITDDEFDRLMDACLQTGTDFARARNSAMIALLRTTGIRVSELIRLTMADWNQREDSLRLTATKNNHPHTVYLHPNTKALLLAWLEIRGDRSGFLFHGARRRLGPLRAESVRFMLRTRCHAAGIEPFGTHDFRRTFATELLRRYDAALVSKLMNHRKLASTLCYDMASDDEMRDAVGSIKITVRRTGGAA